MNRIIACVLIYLTCMLPVALAEDAGYGEPIDYDEQDYPGEYTFTDVANPTADELLAIQSPTLEDFQYLVELNPQEAANYLELQYNNEFAQTFYGEADLSGEHILLNTFVAEEYFAQNYGATYTFLEDLDISEDFMYDQTSGQLINSGQILTLSDYADQPHILGIEVLLGGFIIVEDNGIEEREIRLFLNQEENSIFSYDAATGTFLISRENFRMTSEPEPLGTFLPLSGDAEIYGNDDGTIEIIGPAQGVMEFGDQRVSYTNRRGTLQFTPDGGFSSENAEIVSSRLYVDGAAQYNSVDDIISIWDHGDTELGNIRTGENAGQSIVVYDTVGVASQGQVRGGEQVEIFLDSVSEKYSRHARNLGSSSRQNEDVLLEELRAAARAIPAQSEDLGGGGQVWIQRLDHDELLVTAKGRVEVGRYQDNILLQNEPLFTGRSGHAEFDLRTNGETHIDVRGQADFSYDHGELTTNEPGASVALRIDGSSELMDLNCFACPDSASVVIMERDVVIRSSDGASGEQLVVHVIQQNGQLLYDAPVTELQNLAESLSDGEAIIGRNLDMTLHISEGREQLLRITVPESEYEDLVAYIETYENGLITGQPQSIIFGIQNILGESFVVATERDRENTEELFRILQRQTFDELEHLEFDYNPRLSTLIFEGTGININELDDPEYRLHLREAALAFQEFEEIRENLQRIHGIKLDDAGSCISPSNCDALLTTAISERNQLADAYTAAMLGLLLAEEQILDTIDQSLIREGEEPLENLGRRTTIHNEINSLLEYRNRVTENLAVEAIHLGVDPDDIDAWRDDRAYALEARGLRERTNQELSQVQSEIGATSGAIERLEGELERLTTVVSDQPYVGQAIAVTGAFIAQAQDRLSELEDRRDELQTMLHNVETGSSGVNIRIAGYRDERPDLAAQIALEAGSYDLAREIIEEDVSEIDPERALWLTARTYAVEGDIVLATQLTTSLENPEAIEQVQQDIYGTLIENLEGNVEQQRELFLETVRETEDRYDLNFLNVMRNFGEVYGGALTGVEAAATGQAELGDILDPNIEGFWDVFSSNYAAVRSDQVVQALERLDLNVYQAEQFLRHIREAQAEGLTPTEAFEALPSRLQQGIESTSTYNQYYHALEAAVEGERISEEQQAQIAMQGIQNEIASHGGSTVEVGQDLEQIITEFPDTSAAQNAQHLLEELDEHPTYNLLGFDIPSPFSNRNLDRYGEFFIEFNSADILFPFGAVSKFARAALRPTGARVAARLFPTFTEYAGRASQRLSGFADNMAGLTDDAVARSRSAENIVEQAERARVRTGFWSRDRYLTARPESRAVQTATEEFDRLVAAGAPRAEIEFAAAHLLDTQEWAQQASWVARFEENIVNVLGTRGTTQAATQLGRNLDTLERLGVNPEVLGAQQDDIAAYIDRVDGAVQAEAREVIQNSRNILQDSGVASDDVLIISQKAQSQLTQEIDAATVREAGEGVVQDLATQRAGEAAGKLPTVVPASAQRSVLDFFTPGGRRARAQRNLAESTPQMLDEFIPGIDLVENPSHNLQALLRIRWQAMVEGDLLTTRAIDYKILADPEVNRLLADYVGAGGRLDDLHPLVQQFNRHRGDITFDKNFINALPPQNLRGAKEVQVTGRVTGDVAAGGKVAEAVPTHFIPQAEVGNVARIRSGQRGLVAIGDLHGSYDNLFDDINFDPQNPILRGDPNNPDTWDWVGGDAVIVQIGDIYDRGRYANQIREAFRRLEAQSFSGGGRVVRLVGNHELGYIGGPRFGGMEIENFQQIQNDILADIDSAQMVAATVVDGQLFTHAGVSLRKFPEFAGLPAEEVAQQINQRFQRAIETGDFTDPIFDVGGGAGGRAEQGGIFWFREDEIIDSQEINLGYTQLRGHDPISRDGFTDGVQVWNVGTDAAGSPVQWVNLDVGRNPGAYGGGKGVVAGVTRRPVDLTDVPAAERAALHSDRPPVIENVKASESFSQRLDVHYADAQRGTKVITTSSSITDESPFIDLMGGQTPFRKEFVRQTNEHPNLVRLHQRFEENGVPLNLDGHWGVLVNDLTQGDIDGFAQYSGGAVWRRLYSSEQEVIDAARAGGLPHSTFEEARRSLGQWQTERMVGHETVHHAWRTLVEEGSQAEWTRFAILNDHPDYVAARQRMRDLGYEEHELAEEMFAYRVHYHEFGNAELRAMDFPTIPGEVEMFNRLLFPDSVVNRGVVTDQVLVH